MKCHDCGTADFVSSSRMDVCQECFDLRLLFIKNISSIGSDEFGRVQKIIARGTGEGAAAMKRALHMNIAID